MVPIIIVPATPGFVGLGAVDYGSSVSRLPCAEAHKKGQVYWPLVVTGLTESRLARLGTLSAVL